MLRAINRTLRPGGRFLCEVIAIPPGLSADERREAIELGPDHAPTERGYPALMDEVGFEHVEVEDITPAYRDTQAAWIAAWDAEANGIAALVGQAEFEDRQARRRRSLGAIDRGLLGRYLFLGVR